MSRLPLAPFEKILKESDNKIRVSDGATKAFVEIVEEMSKNLAKDCSELARHANRKTILEQDVKLAGKKKSLYG